VLGSVRSPGRADHIILIIQLSGVVYFAEIASFLQHAFHLDPRYGISGVRIQNSGWLILLCFILAFDS
jgi:hypothetical protein